MLIEEKCAAVNTVLFVDNEPSILLSLQRELRGLGSDNVFCSTADEALDLLSRKRVSVIVSDNLMPGMNGLDLLTQVKYRYPEVIRIMMSGYAELNKILAAINYCEVFRFITKPWNKAVMKRAVEDGLEMHRLACGLKSGNEAIYSALAHTVELRDPYTHGHCDRVAVLSGRLARSLGCGEQLVTHIRHGSILHDCGKIGVPEHALNAPGRLSPEDFEFVKMHPVTGCEVAHRAGLPKEVLNIVLYHHEQYTGSGYPFGLAGDAIPLEARIVAIADVYDALTTTRPYRTALSHGEAMAEMEKMALSHFDPLLMENFRVIVGENMPVW
jgi:putative nucleotidyltransferase with HDIG domain